MKLYNREMGSVKRVSPGTVTRVCICVSNVMVVYVFYLGVFLLSYRKSESSQNGSRVRPVPFPFIPLATPRGPMLHPTTEVYFAILCSAPHKIEFLR